VNSEIWSEEPDLNITPLVDVMLVLMAILMISAPVMNYEEQITLPKGSQRQAVMEQKPLSIYINEKQTITFEKQTYTLRDFADNFALKSNTLNTQSDVYIYADERLAYGDVMYLLKSVKQVGFTKVSLVTQ
jgi:biopolymer transport protein ExbD